ncbi:ABC-2 type transport system permease protein [Streptomyces achromogenes]|uniref:ABC transporter permease n=1 Tax=Streptomyces achromogenes TaxID=67255 RepID=UPI002782B3BC|nr:ABC transporter permease [Streptomyces achromogenes]MDQ0832752.1 ABC-2 type transport system permease protein [Streptomyces achromogenes]
MSRAETEPVDDDHRPRSAESDPSGQEPAASRFPSEIRSPSRTRSPSETRSPSPSRSPSQTRSPSRSRTPARLPSRPRSWTWTLGLFRSELLTTFRRWRTLALLGVLASVPVLVGIAVRLETGDGGPGGPGGGGGGGGGPAFIAQVTNNGLFLVFTALAVTLPFFLPMAIGVIAGDAIAGEANAGTLRYLLVAPAGRSRLLLAKYATVMTFCLVATLVVALSALTVGALLFPLGDLTTISGTRIGFGDGLLRALLIAVVVALSLTGVAALGLFVSTLTGSGIAAMATTVGLLITVQILDQIPQLDALQPYFFSHYWLSFADLMREPVYWDDLQKNLGLQALYAAFFGSAAWARFTTKDVTA